MKNDLAYIVTGAPGSGKTSIMKALAPKGLNVLNEPARAINPLRFRKNFNGCKKN